MPHWALGTGLVPEQPAAGRLTLVHQGKRVHMERLLACRKPTLIKPATRKLAATHSLRMSGRPQSILLPGNGPNLHIHSEAASNLTQISPRVHLWEQSHLPKILITMNTTWSHSTELQAQRQVWL